MKMNNEPTIRPAPSLQYVHATLHALYNREYPNGSPSPHLFEILLPKLPENTRKLVKGQLDALVQHEIGATRTFADLDDSERNALAAFFDQEVMKEHEEVGCDFTLSSKENSIIHYDTQSPIVAHDIITIAAGENPTSLERIGCVFFDGDGTKTIVDCTSGARAGRYFEGLATFFCTPPASIQQWLAERHLHTKAYSYAGDEIIVIVRSDAQAIDGTTLNAFAREVQKALAEEKNLASPLLTNPHVADLFQDPKFIMKYYGWTNEDYATYKRDPASMKERMVPELPERFIPSVSYGVATFLEALCEELSTDTEEEKTLEELGVNAFRLMVHLADTSMKKNKATFREEIRDPRWKAFFLRNAENRNLMSQIEALRAQMEATLKLLH